MKQLDLYFRRADLSKLYSDLGVKVHGFLMSKIPTELAAEFHNGALQPFSLYCVYGEEYGILRLSILSERAQPMIDCLQTCRFIPIMCGERPIRLEIYRKEESPEVSLAQLLECVGDCDRFSLKIVSPAMYRSAGALHHDPNLPAYFDAVLQKLEQFEGIAYTRPQVEEAFRMADIGRFSLTSTLYTSGKRHIYGMIGSLDVTLPKNEPHRTLLRTLLAYATYTGLGGMTTQGMGGAVVETI